MHQRKSKKIFIYFFILIALGSITNLNLQKFNFNKISYIKVTGLNEIENLYLLKKIQSLNLENVFFVNKKKINEIISKNSLVENYKVSKVYPSTLVVAVNQTNLLAKINKDGNILIIGSNGKFIENSYDKKHLPFIFGSPQAQDFLKFKKILDDSKIPYNQIKNFYFFPSKRWDIELKNNTILKLPKDHVKESLDNAFNFLNDKNFKELKIDDVRVMNQIIIND